jgi:thioredoxin reductase (NADPH)
MTGRAHPPSLEFEDNRLPVCEFSDGTRLDADDPADRGTPGWFRDPSQPEYDLAIYGAGPRPDAAVYGASEGLATVLVEAPRLASGKQLRIENYLGFPQGISGAALAERARERA